QRAPLLSVEVGVDDLVGDQRQLAGNDGVGHHDGEDRLVEHDRGAELDGELDVNLARRDEADEGRRAGDLLQLVAPEARDERVPPLPLVRCQLVDPVAHDATTSEGRSNRSCRYRSSQNRSHSSVPPMITCEYLLNVIEGLE